MAKQQTIQEYISASPADIQEKLNKLYKFIKNLIPNAEESISYGVPTFKLKGKPVIYFAGYKNHISIYPFPSESKEFKVLSQKYVTAKGTIQFQNDEPIPFDIVEKITKFRLNNLEERYG